MAAILSGLTFDSISAYDVPKERYCRLEEFTLGKLDAKPGISQYFKHQTQMFDVLATRFAINEDIIHVDGDKFAEIGCKHSIPDTLKSCRRIGQSK